MTDNNTQSHEQTRTIAQALKLTPQKVKAAVELLAAGNTIPFIARYRKEATQGLDEIELRAIEDALEKSNVLAARKKTVLKSIQEQEKLTDALRKEIESCTDIRTLEAIYLPYKPKRRTRATIAIEQGLQPLADILLRQEQLTTNKEAILRNFVNADKGVDTIEAALGGALDIIAELWADDAKRRTTLVDQAMKHGNIVSKLKRGKKDEDGNFELYHDHHEAVSKVPSHRLLAMLRGSSAGILRVSIELNDAQVLSDLKTQLVRNNKFEFYAELLSGVEECYQRLLLPATETTVLQTLKESADVEAIDVFAKNLQELLMAAPAGPRVTMGIDPGFRTGCKVAIVDSTGKFVKNTTIYPTRRDADVESSAKELHKLITQHNVELIAIGNGTASRETDAFVADVIHDQQLKVTKVMVSESGASIYSASEIAAHEFPDLDITVRGAISIARRLQDPLAELVKCDAKSIGVGQYQHDVNQPQLKKSLDRVVQSCVNKVGVDLNMASAPLLSYVAGIGAKLAENIVEHRDNNGRFVNRTQIKKVAKLGNKAFEQSAGFLRIPNGDQALDNSAVHPESYGVVKNMAKTLKTNVADLVGNVSLSDKLNAEDFVDEQFGLPTVLDIINELGKPGRDPRKEFRVAQFDDSVNSIEELKPEMVLEGVITNVTNFGAFVDIGVHQDALIHISQLADKFVKDPNEEVSVGDVVKVKVLETDVTRKRISVTRKL